MTKKRISQKTKALSYDEKQQLLEDRYTEWTGDEVKIKYAYMEFKIAQATRRNSPATLVHYDRTYKKLIAHYDTLTGGHGEMMPVDVMTQPMAQAAFVMSLGKVSDITINSYLRDYRAFGNFFEDVGYIKNFKCPIKKVEAPIKQVYTEKELEALMQKPSIEKFVEFRDYTIISLILGTGARSETIRNLKISDVDLEEKYISFNSLKNKKVVRIKLPDPTYLDLVQYIDRWRSFEDTKPSDYLFCSDTSEGQLSRGGLCKTIRWYNHKHGVQKTSIHLFRHTYAKNWITSGGDIISLANVLTHSELDMVKKYSNLYSEDVGRKIDTYAVINTIPRGTKQTVKKRQKS